MVVLEDAGRKSHWLRIFSIKTMIKELPIDAGNLLPNFGIILGWVFLFCFVSKTLAFEEKGGSPIPPQHPLPVLL